jgi:isoleucyl-tRNA synthetase
MGEVYDRPRESLTPEEKARSLRYQIMDVVDQIKWIPEFGYSREMDWLHNMHDWMISKKRYWGLALPIWICSGCGRFEVIGDDAELKSRAVSGWDDFEGHTPHRPFIDAVKIACPSCGGVMSRIADVGNPWLDAGIVPFSTLAYRSNREYWSQWYPACWISESFPGQFRNWFYSLLAMATVVENSPPFLMNFGYGTLLAEDGRPMHKSSGNSIEFNEAADRMGVDVMRWLYCAHKPENDLLFGYNRGDEVRRQFLIPLWNVYSFFVTYARLDGWEPGNTPASPGDASEKKESSFDPACPEGSTPHSDNLLDRWVLARLNQVIDRVAATLEGSDIYSASQVVEAFLDDLTNWYVRRSRRRFWKSEHDSDKNTAYASLYHVLVKLAKTLAPFTPFVAEVMYQNLVRSVYPQAYESVHHTSWPAADLSIVDEALIEQMSLARRIASLGLSARSGANLKVRQPLSKVLVHVGGEAALRDELVEIVIDELNVKSLEFVPEEGRLVSYRVLPDNKLLGPKFGARFPKVRGALQAAAPAEIAASVRAGQPVTLDVDGEKVELAPAEVLVQTQPAEGLAIASDKLLTVGIDSAITPELRLEGLAREIVRRVQAMRKDAGFNIEDRITTWYQADSELGSVFVGWAAYIQAETLTTQLIAGQPPAEAYVEEHNLDGAKLTIGVKQNRKS